MGNTKNKGLIIILVVLIITVLVAEIVLLTSFFIDRDNSGEVVSNKNETSNIMPGIDDDNNKDVEVNMDELVTTMSGNSLETFDLSFLKLENKRVNKIYSPLSIKYALGMLSEGAQGETKLQIDGLIGNYTAKEYQNNENMSFANALFVKDSYKNSINLNYVNTLLSKYNAEVIYDSFETPNNLNNWVSKKAFNLVNDLYSNISNYDFILTNTLAIDMEWNNLIQCAIGANGNCKYYSVSYKNEKFSDVIGPIINENYYPIKFNNDTIKNVKSVKIGAALNNYDIVKTLGEDNIRATISKEYQEWLKKGGCGNDLDVNTFVDTFIDDLNSNYKRVDMSTDFLLYDDNEVKAFAKDLKEYNGTTLQYVGIMPKNVSLDTYINNITADKLNNVINNLKEIKSENFKEGVITKITGYIPLFKFDYELDLMEDLKQLGVINAFDASKADLSNIVEGAVISDASHKASIEFSNEGIKAAAVTKMFGAGATGCRFVHDYEVPVETIDLTFNNPYLFLIRDKNSGEVWFVGTVYNPSTGIFNNPTGK